MRKSLLTLFAVSIMNLVAAQGVDYPPYISDNIDVYSDSVPRISRMLAGMYEKQATIYTEQRYSEYPMTVYGIAVASELSYSIRRYLDETVYTNYIDTHDMSQWREYTRLYKFVNDSMVLLGEGGYNIFNTPNCTFLAICVDCEADDYTGYADSVCFMVPVYESYFDSGVTISDTYYIGNTNFNFQHNSQAWDPYTQTIYFLYAQTITMQFEDCNPFQSSLERLSTRKAYASPEWTGDTVYKWITLPDDRYSAPYILASTLMCYPILTPNPNPDTTQWQDTSQVDTAQVDTTQVDTMQSSIAMAALLERYVNVYPTVLDGGAVTVLSSFHLEGVEVYDAAGRMLSRQLASGVATTVDVSQLPAGSYVLRINTVSGSTTKKFVQR